MSMSMILPQQMRLSVRPSRSCALAELVCDEFNGPSPFHVWWPWIKVITIWNIDNAISSEWIDGSGRNVYRIFITPLPIIVLAEMMPCWISRWLPAELISASSVFRSKCYGSCHNVTNRQIITEHYTSLLISTCSYAFKHMANSTFHVVL